jgi:hypothetical protein
MSKELMPWAQDAANDFYNRYGNGNCSCHISPPCGSCTHEGNPRNLEETPEAWGEVHEVMALEAQESLANFINELAAQHLWAMSLGLTLKGGAA